MLNSETNNRPHFGEIWMCQLPASAGSSVQSGYRPVFILSNDKNNTYSTTLNIIPITSKMNKRKLPIHVELWNHQKYGLPVPSTMMVEQITTIGLDSLERKIGAVQDRTTLSDIKRAINVQFPILSVC